jgi:hypothetical protein
MVGLLTGFSAASSWSGTSAGIVIGLGAVAVFGLHSESTDLSEAVDPRAVLGRDRTATLTVTFVATATLVLVFVSVTAISLATYGDFPVEAGDDGDPRSSYKYVSVLIFFALLGGLSFAALRTAWVPYLLARFWLAMRQELPWRLMAFLSDAHERRGVLRRVGAVYQFRHLELQARLAAEDEFPK